MGENLLYILVTSIVVSWLSTFYYLRLIKMALFDNFGDVKATGIIAVNSMDVSLSSFILLLLGTLTMG